MNSGYYGTHATLSVARTQRDVQYIGFCLKKKTAYFFSETNVITAAMRIEKSEIHYRNLPHFSPLRTFAFIQTVVMPNCSGSIPNFHTLLTLSFDCVLCRGFRFPPPLFLFQFIQYIWLLQQSTPDVMTISTQFLFEFTKQRIQVVKQRIQVVKQKK